VCPGAVLDTVVKRKIPRLRRELNPRTPIIQPVAQRYHGFYYHSEIRQNSAEVPFYCTKHDYVINKGKLNNFQRKISIPLENDNFKVDCTGS
jgi:hypothetical protein